MRKTDLSNLKWLSALAVSVAIALSSSACTKKQDAASGKVVHLAIWSNYVSPELLQEFEKQTGIKVVVSNYSSNEELLAKLQAGASGYDVAVPSDYMTFVMKKLDLLHELDRAQLPNYKSLDPKYLGRSFDPDNKVSVPYDWGTTGIAVNRSLYKGQVKSWKDLFTKPDLAGKYTLLDDTREVLGAALKAQGFSLNTKSPEELAKAKDLLIKTRDRVKAYTSEPMVPLVNGETAVAHVFMSDALQANRNTGGKIEYIVPEEGCTLWVDSLVIPKGAQHVKEAHEFINFMLSPKSSAVTVQQILVAPTNKETFALLPKDIQGNSMLFPKAGAFANCEMIEDIGDSLTQWDRAWTEIKAGQ